MKAGDLKNARVAAGPLQRWPSRWRRMSPRASLALYCGLILIPLCISIGISYQWNHMLAVIVSMLNVSFLTVMLLQFALSSRKPWVHSVMGIDQAMSLHRRLGEWCAIFFFLHPFLIVLPRLYFAPERTWSDLWLSFTQTNVHTGLFAWSIMLVWTLLAIAKKKGGLSFEAWRYSHTIGFGAVTILGVLHAINVGRHGQLQPMFNWLWVGGGTLAILSALWGLFVRPMLLARKTFRLVSVNPVSESDWELTLENDRVVPFDFAAGQFAWIGTTPFALSRDDHPFSIASAPSELPFLRFVIRGLGDFTRDLHTLKPGMRVRVDGPFGDFTLSGHTARGVMLIGGGAGIAPLLGILRDLTPDQARVPVRLLYGNRNDAQLVAQDEIHALEASLPDFEQILVLEQETARVGPYHLGRMGEEVLQAQLPLNAERDHWLFFVCGPPVMVENVVANLQKLGVPRRALIFEEFGF